VWQQKKDNNHHYCCDRIAKIQKPQNPGITEISGACITKKCYNKRITAATAMLRTAGVLSSIHNKAIQYMKGL
jgi:hypothetical protein